MSALKTITGFLSVRTNQSGARVWTAICHNQPLCASNADLDTVLSVARDVFGDVTLSVWDGDKGEFTDEISTAPRAVAPMGKRLTSAVIGGIRYHVGGRVWWRNSWGQTFNAEFTRFYLADGKREAIAFIRYTDRECANEIEWDESTVVQSHYTAPPRKTNK